MSQQMTDQIWAKDCFAGIWKDSHHDVMPPPSLFCGRRGQKLVRLDKSYGLNDKK